VARARGPRRVGRRCGSRDGLSGHPCRLCGGATRPHFAAAVLGRYPVGYLLCGDCGSLQTEPSYWIEEA
jgi:hypothetical protein